MSAFAIATGLDIVLNLGQFVGIGIGTSQEIKGMCDQQDALNQLKEQTAEMQQALDKINSDSQKDFDTLKADVDNFNNATQKLQNVLKNSQKTSRSKRIFLIILLFSFNLVVLSSLFIKRLISSQRLLKK